MTKGFTASLAIFGLILFLFGFIIAAAADMEVQLLIRYLAYLLMGIGGAAIVVGIAIRKKSLHWLFTFCMGVLALFLGMVILYKSAVAAQYYTFFIAISAALMGGSLVVIALYVSSLKVMLIAQGLLSIVFGAVMYFNPFGETSTLNFIVGCYTILLSVIVIYASYRLSRLKRKDRSSPPMSLNSQ